MAKTTKRTAKPAAKKPAAKPAAKPAPTIPLDLSDTLSPDTTPVARPTSLAGAYQQIGRAAQQSTMNAISKPAPEPVRMEGELFEVMNDGVLIPGSDGKVAYGIVRGSDLQQAGCNIEWLLESGSIKPYGGDVVIQQLSQPIAQGVDYGRFNTRPIIASPFSVSGQEVLREVHGLPRRNHVPQRGRYS